ncbi:MAG: HlyD family type I secretion periplasmic adaptor subunit [Gallionellaceae bacterium]
MFFKSKKLTNKSGNSSSTPLGSRERNLLSESVHIEEELVPAFVRPILYLVTAMIVVFIVWAALTRMKEIARAPGEIVPAGSTKLVQHFDGGVIAAILADEHKLVERGEVLIRMDGNRADSDFKQMKARLDVLRLREERLMAFTENRRPNFFKLDIHQPTLISNQQEIFLTEIATLKSTLSILDRQVAQRKQRVSQLQRALFVAKEQLALTGDLTKMRESLAARQLVNRTVLLETRRAKITAAGEVERLIDEIGVTRNELAESVNRHTDTVNQSRRDALTELGAVRAEMAELEETIQRLLSRVNRLEVRAPIRGYVLNMTVHNIGQVIQPGELLMQIVSDNSAALEAEVKISPRDIGFVHEGQAVNIRVTSYDYSRFGSVKGHLKRVSASSMLSDSKSSYYQGLIELEHPYVGDEPSRNLLKPGMTVEAEIMTGEKTLLVYLIKPLIDVVSMSFHER